MFSCLLIGRLVADASPTHQGLLFEIRAPGSSVTSYLFGTIHSEDPRVIDPPAPVRIAFEACPAFALEVVPDGPALIKAMMTMTYTDGRTLVDVLPPDVYADARVALAELGMSEEAYKDFKPWAIMTQLSTPPSKTGEFLDMRLYRSALGARKRILGLETMDEQLAIFDDLSTEDQISLLSETLASRERLPAMCDELTLAYQRRDLARLQALGESYLRETDPRLADLVRETVVDSRNRRMAERMVPLLDEGGWFIAVGALHLAGETGVVALLRGRGYSVSVVY
ncbi:TraB/GumN family protein [Thiocystis violacea]|uniref:TraB/GumN family protein n=1 Tax=Thiocystis violacea TaxID=13725 RepID=UPI001F5B945B|nr:TraB/GumN family protein [Thiocystis violacea]